MIKKFLSKAAFVIFLPLALCIFGFRFFDVFQIFGFQEYYANQTISKNRGMITTTTYTNRREHENYNSFIFGSSRSKAFKCIDWKNYLDENAEPFHFDASTENLRGLWQKVNYIESMGDTIKNALVIVDHELLNNINRQKGHLYISMPCMGDNNWLDYYFTFFQANMNLKFLSAILDYSIFGEHRRYMGYLIRKKKFPDKVNSYNCDFWYGYDDEIRIDSTQFYLDRLTSGIFYERPNDPYRKSYVVLSRQAQIQMLREINNIFQKNNTKYKIIVSPLYDQLKIDENSLGILKSIFGEENVFDFSGKNDITDRIYNYYESSHFRTHVARKILKQVYE